MASGTIVKRLDVREYVAPGLVVGAVTPVMYQLVLQATEEALYTGIVVTVPLARHARLNTVLVKQLLITPGGVLFLTE